MDASNNVDPLTYASPDDPRLKRYLINAIELLTGKIKLKRLYNSHLQEAGEPAASFWERMLRLLEIELDYDEETLRHIPSEGPLILVANHPYGVLDGIIVCHLTSLVRDQFKILTNSVLCRVEETEPYFLPIDFAETREAIRTNIKTKNRALETIGTGGTVIVFPAGGVSTAEQPFGRATDSEWKSFTARLVKESGATVVPIYFEGQNSRIFQWASMISQTIRLSLLLHEVRNKIGKTIPVEIGDPIRFEDLKEIKTRDKLTKLLRKRTYELAD